ncbi:MAG: carbohydrate ABC transporter permease [Lachnospiraceae bacterium]|nr:carbohydrate ABC transporter permease [Lachnospiraceae bacterium]
MKQKKISQKLIREIRFQSIIEILMLLVMFFAFVPVIVMLIMSFKTNWEIYNDFFALPKNIAWNNYFVAFGKLSTNMINTLCVIAVAVALTLIVAGLSGYVFATMEFPGKNLIYMLILALMMIPGILYLAPNYSLIQRYGLYNTRWALILPWISGGQVLGILLCRNAIEALPKDLFEAAKIEGCNEIDSLVRIAVPLAKPMLSTIAVMKLVDYYNDFIWPMMVIETNSKQVITVAVKVFTSSMGSTEIGSMFAGYVIATIPLFILFMFTSRLYMEGMTAGAVKG